jgi:hypothetical protein
MLRISIEPGGRLRALLGRFQQRVKGRGVESVGEPRPKVGDRCHVPVAVAWGIRPWGCGAQRLCAVVRRAWPGGRGGRSSPLPTPRVARARYDARRRRRHRRHTYKRETPCSDDGPPNHRTAAGCARWCARGGVSGHHGGRHFARCFCFDLLCDLSSPVCVNVVNTSDVWGLVSALSPRKVFLIRARQVDMARVDGASVGSRTAAPAVSPATSEPHGPVP